MAGDYRVNTPQLRQAASQLKNKAAEMRASVASVETAMSPARSMVAPAVAKNIEQWDALKANLQKIFADAESASTIINTLSNNIDSVLGG